MRVFSLLAAIAVLIAMGFASHAAPLPAAGLSRAQPAPLVLVQDKQAKKETAAQKMKRSAKRAWKRVAGYKFNVSCLMSKATCSETGKDREAARSKCMAAHPLCMVNDSK
jgi:dihydroorotate dehydrogenase